jgi:hypothetical protein
MLTRDQSFTVISMVLSVISLALGLAATLYSVSSYLQASTNTRGINAQVRAQRILLQSGGTSLGAAPGGADAASRALQALHDFKLPEDT